MKKLDKDISDEAAQIYADAWEQIAVMPKDELTKTIIRQSVDALTAVYKSVGQLRAEMWKLSEQLPEYPVVMAMDGVGDSLGPQLMAEMGDVMRFARRSAVTAFAGVDPGANQSGAYEAKRSRISKRGSPELRRTLFLAMDCLLKNRPQDNPVYQFMGRKRSEGKPYLVYMTAGANRFLRICYGKVKEYPASLEQPPAADTNQNILVLHIFLDQRFDAGPFVMLFFIVLNFSDFFPVFLLTFPLQTSRFTVSPIPHYLIASTIGTLYFYCCHLLSDMGDSLHRTIGTVSRN